MSEQVRRSDVGGQEQEQFSPHTGENDIDCSMVQEGSWDVVVHVHDISIGLAKKYSPLFLEGKVLEGIWHTNVVVYGREYYFGGGGVTSEKFGQTRWGTNSSRKTSIGKTSIPQVLIVC